MLLHKNHRLFCEGVSFALPDGYYLDTNYGDSPEDSLDFRTEDESLRIRIAIERETKGPLAELNYVIHELEDCTVLEGPEAILLNGLAGYRAVYDTGNRQYCEMRFLVSGSGDNQTELMLLFVGDPKLPSNEMIMGLIQEISPTRVQ